MVQMIEANWLIFIAALLIGIVVAYWLFVHGSKPARRERKPDVLDDGAAPAQRNQALIDAPPVAPVEIPPPTPMGLAGVGEAVQAAADPVPVAPPATAGGDDLTRIKGLGPKLVDQLRALGVTSFAQIAAWDDDEIDRIDAQLGRFQGRIRRDDWPGQARLLAAGDTAGYEATFGRL